MFTSRSGCGNHAAEENGSMLSIGVELRWGKRRFRIRITIGK
jgi:hypothetical protein